MDTKCPEASDWAASAADVVHIWALSLEEMSARHVELEARLSGEERQRADRFLREEVRRKFIVARAALRSILGRYLDVPPAEVPIAIDAHGKPRLATGVDSKDLQFNMAHSGELALVAVTRGCKVGVDVEQLRPVEHWPEIAARYFHPKETAAIAAVDPVERNKAFLRCWTRKEAILKALGVGLGHSLKSFSVPMIDKASGWVELLTPESSTLRRYWLQAVSPSPGYVAAVATEQRRIMAVGSLGDV
ncbi:MAG TPA: 4'-phosphopantetheinyl transferase superfamily protein [Lacipirellulaceae bacterium]